MDEANKENIPIEANRPRTRSINGIDTSRRLYQMSQKLVPIKKPPLPIPIVNTKVVLCQKKFEIEFWSIKGRDDNLMHLIDCVH